MPLRQLFRDAAVTRAWYLSFIGSDRVPVPGDNASNRWYIALSAGASPEAFDAFQPHIGSRVRHDFQCPKTFSPMDAIGHKSCAMYAVHLKADVMAALLNTHPGQWARLKPPGGVSGATRNHRGVSRPGFRLKFRPGQQRTCHD
jgi:hypothetical protein